MAARIDSATAGPELRALTATRRAPGVTSVLFVSNSNTTALTPSTIVKVWPSATSPPAVLRTSMVRLGVSWKPSPAAGTVSVRGVWLA